MDKLKKLTILATIAGAILAFNMYHADYKLLVAEIGTVILLSICLIEWVNGSRRSFSLKGPQKIIWLFLMISAVSFITSPQKLASFTELYKIAIWVLFGILAGREIAFNEENDQDRVLQSQIINVWLLCAGLIALYGILQFFAIDFMNLKLPGGRIVSTFGNATLLAGFLAMTIPVAIDAALKKAQADKKIFVVMVALVIALVSCLVLTKSRGGILAAMAGVGVLYMLRVRSVDSRFVLSGWRALAVLIGVIATGAVLLIMPQSRHIIFDVILRKTARVYLWKDAIHMVKVSPLLGIGLGTFGLYFPDFVRVGVLEMHPVEWEFVNHVHCEYLETLIEMGVIGLLGFLAVAIMVIYRGRDSGLVAGFTAVLLHNIVSVDLRYTSTGLFFWMIAGIVAAEGLSHLEQKEKRHRANFAVVLLIIIAAVMAVYYTLKPYIYVQKAEEEIFFSRNVEEIDRKILSATDDFSLGVLYAKKGDFNTAKRFFIETIKKDPEHAGAFNNLGNIAFMQNDAGKARALFHKALKAEPDNVDYLVNFAYACFKVNVMSEGMKAVEEALEIDPENARARLLQRQMTQ